MMNDLSMNSCASRFIEMSLDVVGANFVNVKKLDQRNVKFYLLFPCIMWSESAAIYICQMPGLMIFSHLLPVSQLPFHCMINFSVKVMIPKKRLSKVISGKLFYEKLNAILT